MDNLFPSEKPTGLEINSFRNRGIIYSLLEHSCSRQKNRYLLSSEEREIYSRLGEKRKPGFLSGRIACRMIMRSAGTDPNPAEPNWNSASEDQYFRPLSFRDPRGKKYHVSISHDSRYSLACAYPSEIGIDVQGIRERIKKIAGRFVSPAEEKIALNDSVLLTVLWTLKESCAKLYGMSLFEAFRKISAIRINNGRIIYSGNGIRGEAVYQRIGSHIACAAVQGLRQT